MVVPPFPGCEGSVGAAVKAGLIWGHPLGLRAGVYG